MNSRCGGQRKVCVFVNNDRDFARVQTIDYLIRLDMLPPPRRRRKRALHDMWLGLALFLPSCLFAVWKLFAG